EVAGALLAKDRNVLLRGRDRVAEGQARDELRAFPTRDARRDEPEDSDAHAADRLDVVGLEDRFSVGSERVGGEPRKASLAAGGLQAIPPEVEFVIAGGDSV